MLASDIANPNFQGAKDPEEMLDVTFYWHQPIDKWKSEHTGQKVLGERQIYVRIAVPGNPHSILETPIREEHKRRFVRKWLAFQYQEGMNPDGEQPSYGWKIEEWDRLTPDQLHELKHLRFATVEQIAGASDTQVQRMGIGGIGLREDARKAIEARASAKFRADMEAKDKETRELKERLAKLEALLMAKAAPIPAEGATPAQEIVEHRAPAIPPKRRGRPPKQLQAE